MIIMVIFIIIIYYVKKQYHTQISNFFNKFNLELINNKVCKIPSINNPFMNPNVTDDVTYPACSLDNKNVNEMIDKYFNEGIFRNQDDIYERTTSKRQFYSVAIGQNIEDQENFAKWLYLTGNTCKENNGLQCYQNIYRDLRI